MLGPILAGDLLTDYGDILYKNLDLLSAFAPIEDLANFGLDALFIVTDSTPPPPESPLLKFLTWTTTPTGTFGCQWQAGGRAFQFEKAAIVTGPYLPVSYIIPDLSFDDLGTLTQQPQAFYRLRQW
jgi:hypothetical protein